MSSFRVAKTRAFQVGVRSGLAMGLAFSVLIGCGADERRGPAGSGVEDSGDSAIGANPDGGVGAPVSDAGTLDNFNPFNPDEACGASLVPSHRVPGSLLFVYDRSSSMEEDPRGNNRSSEQYMGPSKWDTAQTEINGVLGQTGNELNTGMLLFPPNGSMGCDVVLGPGVPQVPIDILQNTRPQIAAQLQQRPGGSNTPLIEALRAGYAHLDGLSTEGQRGLVLVTDGEENCRRGEGDAIIAEIAMHHETKGYLTYAIGLGINTNFLSRVAEAGGTGRTDTCMGECISALPFCMNHSDCPPSQTCGGAVGLPICMGPTDCCNYSASQDTFQEDFATAISDIARRFLDSCVFQIPEAEGTFDPALVNVGVTFEGESRQVLGRSTRDDTIDSWDYTDEDNDAIIIQGPICGQLLSRPADVEIAVGCATILI